MSVAAPHLLEEFAPELNGALDPETLTTGSGRKVWWQCRSGCSNCGRHHNWQVPTVMGLQVRVTDQCLVTPLRQMHMRDWTAQDTVADERSKATAHVQHAVQNLLPSLLVPEPGFATCKVPVHCASITAVQAVVSDRTIKNSGCPICAGQKPCVCNSLATLHPVMVRSLMLPCACNVCCDWCYKTISWLAVHGIEMLFVP